MIELPKGGYAPVIHHVTDPTRRWGLRHGRRLRRGDLIADQIETPRERWPAALRRRVAAVRAEDFIVGPYRSTDLDLVSLTPCQLSNDRLQYVGTRPPDTIGHGVDGETRSEDTNCFGRSLVCIGTEGCQFSSGRP